MSPAAKAWIQEQIAWEYGVIPDRADELRLACGPETAADHPPVLWPALLPQSLAMPLEQDSFRRSITQSGPADQ
jgi:hypothetical protein